ncbi:FAS1-like dehydratase domain-containing protein [Kribbia dieselivorans]|uniref:FAS1-like dehydratase domain-containing protein n=1 Tax=Kribbia dieselivorans TaxID=331526 RepID=UPI000838A2DD|nr:MaoC family dehydratase N-terminal domain-containing protein [Kribbia dieselivorans]
MPVNESFVGRTYPPTATYTVGREKIREFAAAVGATDPLHVDVEAARRAGYADVIAPPTFAVLISQLCDAQFVTDPEAGVDFSRVVHGEQSFDHQRPLVAGDEIVGVLTIESVRGAGGHTMVALRSDLHAVDTAGAPGALVCSTRSMLVIRGED